MNACICRGFYKPPTCKVHGVGAIAGWGLVEDINLPENVHAVESPRVAGENPILRVSPEMLALIRQLHLGTSQLQHGVLQQPLDNCVRCKGSKGGVRGNENIVDGEVLCDYCHAEGLNT
jgi:hypothetical protein